MSTPFGDLLATIRETRGWSQNELGAEAGYDSSYITRLERGKREPSRDTVGALAETLLLNAEDTNRLYVAAGYIPPGSWFVGATILTLLDGDA